MVARINAEDLERAIFVLIVRGILKSELKYLV
jgi:hypothetical protein